MIDEVSYIPLHMNQVAHNHNANRDKIRQETIDVRP
jgi:hypothetical protein